MKKYLILIFVLMSFGIYGQSITRSVGYSSTGLTTAQLNALPTSVKNLEPIIKDTDLGYYVTWDGSAWVALGGGTISITNGTNTTVTGDGSESDPFQINASGDNLGNHSMTANIIPDSDITRSIGNITNNISSIYNRTYIFKPFSSTDPTYTTNLGQTFYRSDLGKIGYWNGSLIKRLATEDQLATAGTDDQTAAEVPITDTGGNYTATDVEGALAENLNLSKANQSIPAATNRSVNTIDDGTFTLQQAGTDLLQIGGNNDDAVYVKALEAMSGSNTISLVSPFALPVRDLTLLDATLYTNALVVSDADSQIYRSDGTTWNLVSGGGGGTSYVPTVATITSAYNILDADKNVKTLIYDSATNDTITIPTNTTTPIAVGSTYTFYQKGTGEILFAPESGTVVMDTVKTTTAKPFASWQKIATNEWIVAGGLDSYVISPPNLYNNPDAANVITEANASTNWTPVDGNIEVVSVDTDTPQDGSFSLRFNRITTNDVSSNAQLLLSEVVNGNTYNIKFWARRISGSNNFDFGIRNSSGTSLVGTGILTDTWTYYDLTFTANTADSFLRCGAFSTTDIGNAAALDGVTITLVP